MLHPFVEMLQNVTENVTIFSSFIFKLFIKTFGFGRFVTFVTLFLKRLEKHPEKPRFRSFIPCFCSLFISNVTMLQLIESIIKSI